MTQDRSDRSDHSQSRSPLPLPRRNYSERASLPSKANTAGPEDRCFSPLNQRHTHQSGVSRIFREHTISSSLELDRLISTYFHHIHPIQANGFLHRPTIERQIQEKSASPLTIKVICAVAASYSRTGHNSNHSKDPERWVQEVKNALMCDTERIGYPKLVATLCLVQHEFGAGRNTSAWTFTALAVRLALAMGLNSETAAQSSADPLEREQRRRLMWAAYACDSICHGGVDDYVLVDANSIRVPLPSSENDFNLSIDSCRQVDMLQAGESTQTLPSGDEGFMSRYVRLMSIRTDILRQVHTQNCFPSQATESPYIIDTSNASRRAKSLGTALHHSTLCSWNSKDGKRHCRQKCECRSRFSTLEK